MYDKHDIIQYVSTESGGWESIVPSIECVNLRNLSKLV